MRVCIRGCADVFVVIVVTLSVILQVSMIGAAKHTKCLHLGVLHKRYFYCEDQTLDIVLESSYRVSHQLTNHIIKILLEEAVGYQDVRIINRHNAMNATRILNRISGCSKASCDAKDLLPIPETMVNTEVWMAAGFNKGPWTNNGRVLDAGPLGPQGRLGWFMPQETVELFWKQSIIIDHWRFLKQPDISIHFSLANSWHVIKIMTHKSGSNANVNGGRYYCNHRDCVEGILYGPNCSHSGNDCGTLLADFSEGQFETLKAQIRRLELKINVAWIGHHLTDFVRNRTLYGLPTLFFNWWPNVLTVSGNYTRVKFPSCLLLTHGQPHSCDFDVNQLNKIVWSKLMRNTREAYYVISHMTLTDNQYVELLKLYNTMTENAKKGQPSMRRIACRWIRDNRKIWRSWLPMNLENKTKIYLGGLFPLSGQYVSQPGLVMGAILALERINQDPNILPNHELTLLVSNTQCISDIATKLFIKFVTTPKMEIAGILGPGCSDTAEPIAALSKHFNMIAVSYEAEAMSLADRSRYPYFFRTIPQVRLHRFVYGKFFQAMGWTQVSTLSKSGQEFPEYHILLQEYLSDQGINVALKRKILSTSQDVDLSQVFYDLRKAHIKIIICDLFESATRAVICEAYRQKMTAFDGYVWFLPPWFTQRWWDVDFFNSIPAPWDLRPQENVPCETEEMLKAVEGHFILAKAFYDTDSTEVVGGITVADYKRMYTRRVGIEDVDKTDFASYVYDTVWVWAFALDKVFRDKPSAIEHLHSRTTTDALMAAINSTNFQGITGKITFEGADRLGIINVMQFSKNGTRMVGRYIPHANAEEEGMLELYESSITWLTPDGLKPSDGRPAVAQCSIENLRVLLNVSCESAIIIVNIFSLGIFIVITIIFLLILKRRYDTKVRATRERMKELGLMPSDLSAYLSLDDWEISREQVVLNRKLGEGAFGTVYGGEAHLDDKGWVAVAVKTLKIGSKPEEKLDFLSEAEMMKRFSHSNIVALLGVCTRGEPAYAIMEFMLHGDLKTYLLSRRSLIGQDMKEAEDITPYRLTEMALDVASGLKYLHDLKYVHRDLACRNCLVHANKTVKIGDFGMTRPMYDSDYYRFNRKGMLPVRWMSPESLCDGLFTAMSDIWSYGVLVYEIVTFGSFPYQGLSNNQVLEHVKSGQCLTLPENCPEQLKMFIKQCMAFEPGLRPKAIDIINVLTRDREYLMPCLDAPITSVVMDCTDSLELTIPSVQNTVNRSSTFNFPMLVKRSSSSQERLALLRSNLHVPPPQSSDVSYCGSNNKLGNLPSPQRSSASPRSSSTMSSTPERLRRHSIATPQRSPRDSPLESHCQLAPLLSSPSHNQMQSLNSTNTTIATLGNVSPTRTQSSISGGEDAHDYSVPRNPPLPLLINPHPIKVDNTTDNASGYFNENKREIYQAITSL